MSRQLFQCKAAGCKLDASYPPTRRFWCLLLFVQVLSAYTLMASKARADIETAVGQLLDMANSDPNNVPVLMALAHGFLLLKQTAKARNQLKVRTFSGAKRCTLERCSAVAGLCASLIDETAHNTIMLHRVYDSLLY